MTMTKIQDKLYSDIKNWSLAHDYIVLEALGLFLPPSGEIRCSCPVHGGDNQHGFSYSSQYKCWTCWTHHCHEEHGSSIFGLVKAINDCSIKEAIKFINSLRLKYKNREDPKRVFEKKSPEIKYYKKDQVLSLNHHVPYLIHRGISLKTLEDFHCFYNMYRAWIPVFDTNNRLVAFTGRQINGDSQYPKWLNRGSPLRNFLLGMNLATNIKSTGKVILVEGPIDLLKIYDAGSRCCVASFHNNLSMEQLELLKSVGVQELYICYDPDQGGFLGSHSVQKKAKNMFEIINLSNRLSNDPGDMSIGQIHKEILSEVQEWDEL